MTAFKNNLEKEINLIQFELDSNPSNINLERFNTAEKELEQIDKHEIHGLMLRSKTKWLDEGEKNSFFF